VAGAGPVAGAEPVAVAESVAVAVAESVAVAVAESEAKAGGEMERDWMRDRGSARRHRRRGRCPRRGRGHSAEGISTSKPSTGSDRQ